MSDPVDGPLALLQACVTGRYSIEREVGRGGMGIVYLARDVSLDRRVAIKLLPSEFTAERSLRERFMREARIAARLSHPHIVPVYSVEEHPDSVFYVMGFIEGETLAARIERAGQIAPAEVAAFMQQVAWALAYAHGNGVVHRDIKPDNILLEQGTSRAWVMDFGIARALETAATGQPQSTRLTQMGHVVGTAAYMSPEQAAGEEVDGRSDLYSLGVVAYLALTGRLPFDATSTHALLAKHLTEIPPPVASVRPGIPATLARTVDQLLAKDPAARPATGEAVADAVSSVHANRADVAPPIRNFLRAAEQDVIVTTRFLAIVLAVGAARPLAMLPILMAGLGSVAGSIAALIFRARRLTEFGYRWPDIRDGVALFASERAEENREVAKVPAPGVLRRAAVRMVVSVTVGITVFIGGAFLGKDLRVNGGPNGWIFGLVVVVITSLVLIVSTGPLAYYIAMRQSGRALAPGRDRRSFGLSIWASPFGQLLFGVASRGVLPQPPRNATAALDQLIAEVEASVPKSQRRLVQAVRRRLDAYAAESQALRTREREIDRGIAEAGAGQAADQMAAARRDIAPRVERIAATTDEIRLSLLLVRSGVRPVTDLAKLAAD